MRYVAIYGYSKSNGQREHLGNITHAKYTDNSRTYDFSSADISGKCDFPIKDDLIYVINTASGKAITSGFTKNVKKLEGNEISFTGDDFKRILDSDVLIDFTGLAQPNHSLRSIFERVTNAIQSANRDTFISKIGLRFVIPYDLTDTKTVADYTGQYLIVNALKFLKVYLSYYGYYIKPYYEVESDVITFEFKKSASDVVEIKLKDFIHEKTSNDIKVNKTVATIAYAIAEKEPEWLLSSETYFNSQPTNNRATVEESDGLPPATGYSPGFALRVVKHTDAYTWVEATASAYAISPNKVNREIYRSGAVCNILSIEEAAASAGSPTQYAANTVVAIREVRFNDDGSILLCPITYIKINAGGTQYAYYQLSQVSYTKRPYMPERIYLLGKDNQIYEEYDSISESNRIYPIVSKIFEAQYLAEAQVNAVYELVNNRYVENIIVTLENIDQPLDPASLELYTMIRVYDDAGDYKDLPISEKTTVYSLKESRTEIKLGFKKTLLTEIIKNDIGEAEVVKSSGGGGSTTIIDQAADIPLSDETEEPDPTKNQLWFAID